MKAILRLTNDLPPIAWRNYGKIDLHTHDTWSGGEVNIRLTDHSIEYVRNLIHDVYIVTKLNNSHDVMTLIMARNIFTREAGCPNVRVHAVFPYIPYARQDRIVSDGEPFSLKVFASLINAQQFDSVRFFDAHSSVSKLLINNSFNTPNHQFVKDALNYLGIFDRHPVIVSPDVGAFKRTQQLVSYLNHSVPVEHLAAIKQRSSDGDVEHIDIAGAVVRDKTYVIVDDICDGGRTFIKLAQALIERGASKVHLIVSHGIFSHGYEQLFASGFQTITTTTSISSKPANRSDVYKHNVFSYMWD